MKISYNWLKWYVPEIPEAEKLADVFTYHLCEVEGMEKLADGDTIFDLNILPNRAHDLLSHQGIARELSGQLGITFKDPTELYKIPETQPTTLDIDAKTPVCRRYMGRIVHNVTVGPSPEWVVKHLESIGQRSINNIVDATNIVLFDCGQPTHVFDAKKLKERICIRSAATGEKIQLLGGEEKELKETDLVIADTEGVLALAGVKGGTKAEVDANTVDIVLEVANFDPATVRKTARRFGLLTDASKRFENDLSPELAAYGMRELSATILEMCPEATFEEIVDIYPSPQQSHEIVFSVADVNKRLGTNISADEIAAVLHAYHFTIAREETVFKLLVPALRLDLVGVHDVVEEIGRIVGYEDVVPTIPAIDFTPKKNSVYAQMSAVRETLLADGYSEVVTYAFCKKGKVEVARGAKGKEFLRTNLADGLKDSYELNRLHAPLIGQSEIKIFEIGTVFPSLSEEIHVAYADKKGVVESTLKEFTKDQSSWILKQVQDDTIWNTKFVPWSNYPFITRDVAVWVPVGTNPDELISLCKNTGTALLIRDPQLFDQFTKDEKTSLAVRLVFQSMERTLTDTEVTEIMTAITSAITAKGWEIR
jgi:phenylalanyl-tRNA synthetase beta chain